MGGMQRDEVNWQICLSGCPTLPDQKTRGEGRVFLIRFNGLHASALPAALTRVVSTPRLAHGAHTLPHGAALLYKIIYR
jgi:hypothetical protein